MATKERRKAPGRVAVLFATGLASATFLFAIVNTPTSTQAALQSASVAQVSTSTSQPASTSTSLTSTGLASTQASSAQTSSTQTTTSTARFRTRAS